MKGHEPAGIRTIVFSFMMNISFVTIRGYHHISHFHGVTWGTGLGLSGAWEQN